MKQKITREAVAPKVVGKSVAKPTRPMTQASRISQAQVGIGTQPPKFVPQPRKK